MIFEFGEHLVASRHVVKMRLVRGQGEKGQRAADIPLSRIEMMLDGANLLIHELLASEDEARERMMEIAEWIG